MRYGFDCVLLLLVVVWFRGCSFVSGLRSGFDGGVLFHCWVVFFLLIYVWCIGLVLVMVLVVVLNVFLSVSLVMVVVLVVIVVLV